MLCHDLYVCIGYMYTYSWLVLLHSRNYQNMVNQLYSIFFFLKGVSKDWAGVKEGVYLLTQKHSSVLTIDNYAL